MIPYKSCTIIPTHQPHFGFTINALESYNKNVGGDLYLIFSNTSEYQNFKAKTTEKFNYLILDESYYKHSNIINAKKFYAVNELAKKYKYLAVFDAEIEFVKPYDEYFEYKQIFKSKQFKGNISTNGREILTINIDLLQLDEPSKNIVLEETQNLDYYWWFNEACVYETQTFYEFFEWLKSKDTYDRIMSTHLCFDYLLYSIWLISYKNFKIKKFDGSNFKWGALEYTPDLDIINQYKSLVSKNSNSEYTKIIIHKDRG